MASSDQFNEFMASRGEGLHPRLQELFERTAVSPISEVTIRPDGMLQAGPDPESDAAPSRVNVTLFPTVAARPGPDEHEPKAHKFPKQVP
jgi:hypothetical protein